MSFDNIYLDDGGQECKLTFIDTDTDAAADISGYTDSQLMIFTDPAGTETSETAAFDTDGSDGIITFTPGDGYFDTAGDWFVRGRVTTTTATLSTQNFSFKVHE